MAKLSKMAKSMSCGFSGENIFVTSRSSAGVPPSPHADEDARSGNYPTRHKAARAARDDLGWGIVSTSHGGAAPLNLAKLMFHLRLVPDDVDKILCLGEGSAVNMPAARLALERCRILYDDCGLFGGIGYAPGKNEEDFKFSEKPGVNGSWTYFGKLPMSVVAQRVRLERQSKFRDGLAAALADDLGLKAWYYRNEPDSAELLSAAVELSLGMLDVPDIMAELLDNDSPVQPRWPKLLGDATPASAKASIADVTEQSMGFFYKADRIRVLWQAAAHECGFSYGESPNLPPRGVLEAMATETGVDKMMKAFLVNGCPFEDVTAGIAGLNEPVSRHR